tara:strand:- start:94 stop:546 length:453 start_codon:yes stop_codon:yes gene_type:complete
MLLTACARKPAKLEFPPVIKNIENNNQQQNTVKQPLKENDLTSLDSILEIINTVPKGRDNPFYPVASVSDSINEIKVLGFLLTNLEKRAFIKITERVNIICEGPRGLCSNTSRQNNELLPKGWLVLSIDHLEKCVTVVKETEKERTYCMS